MVVGVVGRRAPDHSRFWSPPWLARLADVDTREELNRYFRDLGFQFITLDLEGFRSGSLNTLVSLESKLLYKTE